MGAKIVDRPRALGEAEYAELIRRVREVAARTIPPGASVLVVSKGDDALLGLGGYQAGHFPQDSTGGYSGYYPADSKDAIDRLETLRRGGAEYLVFPDTARWWLDQYPAFATHLSSRYVRLADEPACVVFSLTASAAGDAQRALDLSAARHDQRLRQLRELLQSLLPEDATIAVVTHGDHSLLELGFPAQDLPLAANGVGSSMADVGALTGRLREIASAGSDYLIVPYPAPGSPAEHDEIATRLEGECELVARQAHLGLIFSLDALKEDR